MTVLRTLCLFSSRSIVHARGSSSSSSGPSFPFLSFSPALLFSSNRSRLSVHRRAILPIRVFSEICAASANTDTLDFPVLTDFLQTIGMSFLRFNTIFFFLPITVIYGFEHRVFPLNQTCLSRVYLVFRGFRIFSYVLFCYLFEIVFLSSPRFPSPRLSRIR